MDQGSLLAKIFPLHVPRFVHIGAFWAAASDETLKPAEQKWLEDQFGEAGVTHSLQEFVERESDAFLHAFDHAVRSLMRLDSETLLWAYRRKGQGGITAVDIREDGRLAVVATDIGHIRVMDLNERQELYRLGEKRGGAVRTAAFNADGMISATRCDAQSRPRCVQ